MAFGCQAVLFPNLALEQVSLWLGRRERWIRSADRFAAADGQRAVGIKGDDRDEPHVIAIGHAKP